MEHFFTAKLEKHIAYEIVNNEINVENNVTKKMALILENNIATIQKQKRVVTKLMQDTDSARHKHQVNRLIISDTVAPYLYRYNLYFRLHLNVYNTMLVGILGVFVQIGGIMVERFVGN